jgi:molybdopterin-containing oxidoreductase family membrane subunit
VPNPLGHVKEYWPTAPETLIAIGIYALGGIVLTVLYKIAIGVREEQLGAGQPKQEPHAEPRKELKVA